MVTPARTSTAAIRQTDTPDARITVYSDCCAICVSAKVVPISAATGSTSYRCPGMFSTT